MGRVAIAAVTVALVAGGVGVPAPGVYAFIPGTALLSTAFRGSVSSKLQQNLRSATPVRWVTLSS